MKYLEWLYISQLTINKRIHTAAASASFGFRCNPTTDMLNKSVINNIFTSVVPFPSAQLLDFMAKNELSTVSIVQLLSWSSFQNMIKAWNIPHIEFCVLNPVR